MTASGAGPPTGPHVLELEIETLHTPEREILGRIDWTIRRGEHWAIVGPNGAGKTTLLRVLAGYLWPSRGRVAVLGRRFGAYDLRELRREIGVVSTVIVDRLPAWETAQTVVETGFEGSTAVPNAELNGTHRARAREALAATGAETVAGREFATLSQGERQRVLISRALVGRPALLLLDEPCAGLDPVARERFLADLGRLAARGDAPSLVLVTHHVEEIPPFVTHLLAINAGRVVAGGAIGETLTSEVMGETFGLPCRVERGGGRWRLDLDGAVAPAS